MELIGSIVNQGTLQGEVNDANGYLTGIISNAGLLGGQVVAERGLQGEKGDTGDTGATGVGISSVAKTGTAGKVDTYTITYSDGNSTTFTVTNGNDGTNGQDGYSPSASVSKAGDTATITITDENGTTTASVTDGSDGKDGSDGADGKDGKDGADGHSPVVTASKVGKTTTVYVDGSSVATILDGDDGTNGTDGYSPSASVNKAGDTATITITDENGTTTASVTDGADGENGILYYGQVDNTSTATVYTATIAGITEYKDGLAVLLKNGVVTSAAGFTININNLGAKQAYNNMAAATAETTLFNVNYTMLFIYDSTRVAGGGWICYRGYDANTNTIGYQIRTNSYSLPMDSVTYRYRLLFTSADNKHFVPANNSTSTNATASRTVCQSKIDPFGAIVYYGTTASVAAGSRPSAANLWQEYTLTLGYSFNRTGAALTLTSWKPVYVKCAPQADGSAIMDDTTPYVQELPSTADGKIYIYLGVAYSETQIELNLAHPVYYYANGGIRQWTSADIPTKVSQLTNDSGFITLADLPIYNGGVS